MKDLFGNEVGEAEARRLLARKGPVQNGYAAPPGSGPQGETCGSCAHLVRRQRSRTYLKCGLMARGWTAGAGTDVRAKAPACRRWQAPS